VLTLSYLVCASACALGDAVGAVRCSSALYDRKGEKCHSCYQKLAATQPIDVQRNQKYVLNKVPPCVRPAGHLLAHGPHTPKVHTTPHPLPITMCAVPVQHGAEQRLHHAQRVHAGLLAILVGRPQVRHCAVRRLELCEGRVQTQHRLQQCAVRE
jgi:hypothetical protein